ncbi:hypothetical protein ACTA71_010474 [Dictyostelium dimigraforme]
MLLNKNNINNRNNGSNKPIETISTTLQFQQLINLKNVFPLQLTTTNTSCQNRQIDEINDLTGTPEIQNNDEDRLSIWRLERRRYKIVEHRTETYTIQKLVFK